MICLLALSLAGAGREALPTCTVDWWAERQEIEGFGGSGAFHQAANLWAYPERERALILDLLFSREKGIGLSIVRNIIGDGGDWGAAIDGPTPSIQPEEGVWNWSGDEDQIWLMREAAARGCTRFVSTAWSPPAWMKTNNSVIQGGELRPDKYQAFAEYLANYVRGYREHHQLEIYAISPANEPDLTTDYSSCRWTGLQLRNFIKHHLAPTLKREGIDVKVMIPETMNFTESYALATLNDPEARDGVDIIGVHAYDFMALPFPVAKSHQKAIWQTEVSNIGFNDGTIDDGLKYAKLLHDHLTITEVNAWLFWWLAAYKPGEALIHLDTDYQTFTAFKRLYTIGNYSRFVRPGDVRLEADRNPAPHIFVTAFKDKASGRFALVAINNGEKERVVRFALRDFPATGAVVPYRTSATEDLAKLAPVPVVDGSFTVALKGKSVTTFIPVAHELPGVLSIRDIFTPLAADSFNDQAGIALEITPDGETAIVLTGPHAYAAFQNFNFGMGPATCELKVAIKGRGKLELKLHSPDLGLPLARYSVVDAATAGQGVWQTISVPTAPVRGVNDFYLVFTPWDEGATCRVAWLAFKAPDKQPAGRIKVQMANGDTRVDTNQIKLCFTIVNNGSVPVNLAEVQIRYYYTRDGAGPQEFSYTGGTLPAAVVTGRLVPMAGVTPEADHYLEIGFTEEAGLLPPAAQIEVAGVITSLGGVYRQENDFSFQPQPAGMMDWPAVTGYVQGRLCWGSEPSLLVNPGFETGTLEGWFNFGGPSKVTVTDETAHTGSYCALITGRTENWQGIAQDLSTIMKPGRTYEISAWIKLKNKMHDAGRINVKRTDDQGDNYTWVGSATVNDEEWTWVGGRYELQVNGTLKTLELYTEGPGAGVEYYVDNVVVREVVAAETAE